MPDRISFRLPAWNVSARGSFIKSIRQLSMINPFHIPHPLPVLLLRATFALLLAVSTAFAQPVPGAQWWLDANDLSTLTTNANGTVTNWANKGASGGVATQPFQPDQPELLSGAINGKPAVRFQPNLGFARFLSGDYTNTGSTLTLYLVVQWENVVHSAGSETGPMGLFNNPAACNQAANTQNLDFSVDDTGQLDAWRGFLFAAGPEPGGFVRTAFIRPRVPYIVELRYDGVTGYLEVSSSTNTDYSINGNYAAFNVNKFVIGGRANGCSTVQSWDGHIAELLIYNSNISKASDRELVKNYLRQKWLGVYAPAAGSGDWTGTTSGSWGNTNNWAAGMEAYGAGRIATFALDVSGERFVTNSDSPRTIGYLRFGDTSPGSAGSWNITGPGMLNLDGSFFTSFIDVTNSSATISQSLLGRSGLIKNGAGWLTLARNCNYPGSTTVNAGTLALQGTAAPALSPVAGAVVWVDAADPAAVTTNASGGVTALANKGSGGGSFTVPATMYNPNENLVSGTSPALVPHAMNGRPVVRFNGNNQALVGSYANTGSSITMFYVLRQTGIQSPRNWQGFTGFTRPGVRDSKNNSTMAVDSWLNFPGYWHFIRNTDNEQAYSYVNQFGRNVGWNEHAPVGAPLLLRPGTNESYVLTFYQNGTTLNAAYLTDELGITRTNAKPPFSGLGNFNVSKLGLGCRVDGGEADSASNPWPGDIAEVLIYNSALSAANRAQVENYLRRKWLFVPGANDNILPRSTSVSVGNDATLDVSGVPQQAVSALTLSAGSTVKVMVNAATSGRSQIHVRNSATFAGALVVTNVSGTLSLGQSFQVFTTGSRTGNFSSITPTPGSGLGWDFNPTNGTLAVVSGSVTPPTLQFVSSSTNTVVVSWAGSGFRLQAQTNVLNVGLSDNWADYPGGGSSPVVVPIVPANGSVFLRLISP
jgi:autotransporter-associated beta strand protein